jgi:hypothetical protein
VNPSLRHCLHLLQLESLFHLAVSA